MLAVDRGIIDLSTVTPEQLRSCLSGKMRSEVEGGYQDLEQFRFVRILTKFIRLTITLLN